MLKLNTHPFGVVQDVILCGKHNGMQFPLYHDFRETFLYFYSALIEGKGKVTYNDEVPLTVAVARISPQRYKHVSHKGRVAVRAR